MNRSTIVVVVCGLAILAGGLVWYESARPEEAAPDAASRAGRTVPEGEAEDGGIASRRSPIATSRFRPAASQDAGPGLEAGERLLEGRVLDPLGAPVAGAMVGEVTSPEPVSTGDDGDFALPVPASQAAVTLLVLAEGQAPFIHRHDPEGDADPDDPLELRLVPPGVLRGSVTTADGRPIAGAGIALAPGRSGEWPGSVEFSALHPPTSSDAQGRFRFAGLRAGTYRVSASAPGRMMARSARVTVAAGAGVGLDPLVLDVGHRLVGRVVAPDGAPVEGAAIEVRNAPGRPRHSSEARSAEDGGFAFDGLPAGPLRLEVRKSGFLSHRDGALDPTTEEERVIRLEAGLRIRGLVRSSGSGEPVERFAATLRRLGPADPASLGSMEQQLRRKLGELRRGAAEADSDADRDRLLEVIAALESRDARVRGRKASRIAGVSVDAGPAVDRPGGRFTFDGLDEGRYRVSIAAPDHPPIDSEPFVLRRGAPAPELTLDLPQGHRVSGVVVTRGAEAPVAGAEVTLLALLPSPEPSAGRPTRRVLRPWLFGRGSHEGVAVETVRTAADGRFAFAHAAPGSYVLSVTHPAMADLRTEPVPVAGPREALRLVLGPRATLEGRVIDGERAPGGRAEVLALGGYGTMEVVAAGPDGSYRLESLPPGPYLVRALPAGDRQHRRRLLARIYPVHAGAAATMDPPTPDLTLAEGETRTLDLALDLPPSGSVRGAFRINGRPATGCRVVLVPRAADGAGRAPTLRTFTDPEGEFALEGVPPGRGELRLYGPTRQELHRAELLVEANRATDLAVDAPAGGLRGRILPPDAADPAELQGTLWVLPGLTEAPQDLHEHRRRHRTHRLRVRAGAFEDAALTPGPALLILQLRDRPARVSSAVIPAGATRALDLEAPAPRR